MKTLGAFFALLLISAATITALHLGLSALAMTFVGNLHHWNSAIPTMSYSTAVSAMIPVTLTWSIFMFAVENTVKDK